MSWTRKILRVNLTKGTVVEEALNMEWANDYLGQRGLATRYLVDELSCVQKSVNRDGSVFEFWWFFWR